MPLREVLQPYPVAVGIFAVAAFAMHGAIYLYLKTEGELQSRIQTWMWTTFGIFLVVYMLVTIFTMVSIPHVTDNLKLYPWTWVVPVLNILAIANIPRAIYLKKPLYAFLSSCATIAAFTFLFGLALYPHLIVSSLNPEWSLTVTSAASTHKTLTIMAIVALLGMPFVLAYTAVVYWVFRGKVETSKLIY
jgi:cytochrome d ubiquinol oxidase subunit II